MNNKSKKPLEQREMFRDIAYNNRQEALKVQKIAHEQERLKQLKNK